LVLIRQRPGKGNAVFITIEDETGIVNALLWARDLEEQRRAVMAARLMLIDGEIQRSKEGVIHLMVRRVTDATAALSRLTGGQGTAPPELRKHPRNVRIIPKSRDFH
jgi:error-prone DNA polymerase